MSFLRWALGAGFLLLFLPGMRWLLVKALGERPYHQVDLEMARPIGLAPKSARMIKITLKAQGKEG